MQANNEFVRWNGMLIHKDSPCLYESGESIDNSKYINCDEFFYPEEFESSYYDERGYDK